MVSINPLSISSAEVRPDHWSWRFELLDLPFQRTKSRVTGRLEAAEPGILMNFSLGCCLIWKSVRLLAISVYWEDNNSG